MSSGYYDYFVIRVHHAQLMKEAERERQLRRAKKSRRRPSPMQNLLAKITNHT